MLRDPRWEEFLAGPRFNAQPCEYLEICHYEDGHIEHVHRRLEAVDAVEYLDNGAAKFRHPTSRTVVGKSRMLLYTKTKGIDDFPNLPFSSGDIKRLTNEVGFSSRFFYSHVKLRRIAAQFTTEAGQSWFIRNWLASMTTLQRTKDNTNLSIIILDDTRRNLKIDQMIKECLQSQELSLHPFLAMLILIDHIVEDYRDECDDIMARSARIHTSLGLPVEHLGPAAAFEAMAIPVPQDTSKELAVDRETLIQLCGSLKSFNASLDELRSLHDKFVRRAQMSGAQPVLASRITESADSLSSMLQYLVVTSKDMLDRMQQIETRLQWLFPMLQLKQARHDTRVSIRLARTSTQTAVAAKRDSSSMMVIAVLTTLFLPGTFVATLLSSPGYTDWSADPWKYWAITIPLTGMVMAALGYWMWRLSEHNVKKDEELDATLDQELEGTEAQKAPDEEAIQRLKSEKGVLSFRWMSFH